MTRFGRSGRRPHSDVRLESWQIANLTAFLGPRWMPDLAWTDDLDRFAGHALAALCAGRTSLAELAPGDAAAASSGSSPAQRAALGRGAPVEYRLPSGRTARVRYEPDRPPAVAARIQEVFGLAMTPGRFALVIERLAPNGRPVQVTDDLGSFWRTYGEVRKLLRGRYPKHAEDPWRAAPRARPGPGA